MVSPDVTNEEAYAVQQFTRAVMRTNNVDRHLSVSQLAVEQGVRASLGQDVAHTNNLQEFFSDVKSVLVVGPNVTATTRVPSYWLYHSRIYREAKTVVISEDNYPLGWRSEVWLKPNPGTTVALLNGIARQIIDQGYVPSAQTSEPGFARWVESLASFDLASVAATTGCDPEKIARAASLYATGGTERTDESGNYPPSLIYQHRRTYRCGEARPQHRQSNRNDDRLQQSRDPDRKSWTAGRRRRLDARTGELSGRDRHGRAALDASWRR